MEETTAEQRVRGLEQALLGAVDALAAAKRQLENAQTALQYCEDQELFRRLVAVKRDAEAEFNIAWGHFIDRCHGLERAIEERSSASAPFSVDGVR
jgi:hypothetical protein